MSNLRRPASLAAVARAQALVPQLAELLENHDPCQAGLKFNQIEASAAAIGDVLARLLMKTAAETQAPASEGEVAAAYRQAREKAGLPPQALHAEAPSVRRMRKQRTLKTMRGEVPIEREYLYFPGLKTGVFPPRPTS